jgi:hypothetical protein
VSASARPSFAASNFVSGSGRARFLLALALLLLGSLVFGVLRSSADAPAVTVEAASQVGFTTAKAKGTVNPEGKETSYHFEFTTQAQFEAEGWNSAGQTPVESVAAGTAAVPVQATLEGLVPGTKYHLRLVAENEDSAGTPSEAEAATFETKAVTPPVVSADDATQVTGTTAHFSGEVTAGGTDPAFNAQCRFEYITDAAFQNHNEVQALYIRATAGVYKLRFEGEETAQLDYNVGAATVQSALEALPSIGPGGITVTPGNGGPPSGNGAKTLFSFILTFPDPIDVPQIGTEAEGLTGPGSNFEMAEVRTLVEGHPEGFGGAQTIACEHGTPGTTSPVEGTSPVEVSADPTGLEPNTVYHLRLTAENQGGQDSDVASNFKTEAVAPVVIPVFGSPVGAHAGVLAGEVNPRDSTVTYQFEWGTDESYGNVAPASPASLGFTDDTAHRVTAQISGLQEDTTYHFRLVATNTETSETTQGEDRTFTPSSATTPPSCPNEPRRAETNSLGLPDCRAYELAMPSQKDYPFGQLGSEVAVAARAGGAIAYKTFGPMPGSVSGSQENFNLARRGPEGWSNTPLSPAQETVPNRPSQPNTSWVAEDLTRIGFYFERPALAPGATPNVFNLYLENTEDMTYTLLTTKPPSPEFGQFAAVDDASTDNKHVFFETLDQLLPEANGGFSTGLYEWEAGQLRYVAIYPDNTTSASIAVLGNGGGGNGNNRITNAVSSDGSRVVWSDINQLYDRINHTSTIRLSASQRSTPDPTGQHRAFFWGASDDGSKVFFTDEEALTDDAVPGAGADLYEYDFASGELTDLSVTSAGAGSKADVQGVVGNSEDGEYVYFVARGDLGGGAEAGAFNLYVSHAGETRYIGTLDQADQAAWGQTYSSQSGQAGVTARVAAQGALAIQSVAPLTGYDNVNPVTETPTKQVYLYSPQGDVLTCVSCRPDGSTPAGDATITPPDYEGSTTRNISADGERLFFDSTDAIVPSDGNGRSDVYEWTEGAAHLISDASDNNPAFFQDASADGNDVFFSTGARLVAQDTDEHRDLYDARVGGGYPRPPVPPASCEGEGCRAAGSSAPNGSSAVTGTFSGPGNPQPHKRKGNAKARAKALKSCRRKHKHEKQKRKKCESRVKKRFANQNGRSK